MRIENTKCECGHQNYTGTVLCESCGKPLYDDHGSEPLEMRYDGVARRSQRSNPTWLDRIWNFFSSVKIAIYLILITLAASAIGTVYPQENTFINLDPSTYYKQTYGTLGEIYYLLGLSHTFNSWWYRLLLFMIGTSLVICSLDRVLPLYRALSKQQIRKHPGFISRQKVTFARDIAEPGDQTSQEQWVQTMASALRKRHYRVHTDGTALMAEKYRFSRWGPYINHIGLIIFLLAALARSIPGWHMDQYMGFIEGQTLKIPNTPYYLKNEKFTVDYYKPEEMSDKFKQRDLIVPKMYETQAVLYQCTSKCGTADPVLKEVARHPIRVNDPLDYHGFMAYQFDYKETPQLISVTPSLRSKKTGEVYGSIELDMNNPQKSYQAGPYHLELKSYFPDFGLDDQGQPMTKSNEPKAPAFIFTITGPGMEKGQPYLYFPRMIDKDTYRQDDVNGAVGQLLDLSVGSMEGVKIAQYTSYLNIRVDKALPYIWFGAAVSMIGLVMGFYWQHRRVWLRVDDGKLLLGAHTNKNWFGLRKEVAAALVKAGIEADPKTLETGRKTS